MFVLVVVLVVTNAVTVAVLVRALLRLEPVAGTDVDLHEAFAAQRREGATRIRRLISVEILNPLDVARSRGRMAGLAGALVPNLTTRIVYDKTLKILRHELTEQDVAADVRLHTLRPARAERPGRPERPVQVPPAAEVAVGALPEHETIATDHYLDEVDVVDLEHLPEQPPVDADPERPNRPGRQ